MRDIVLYEQRLSHRYSYKYQAFSPTYSCRAAGESNLTVAQIAFDCFISLFLYGSYAKNEQYVPEVKIIVFFGIISDKSF